jgi:hypothetical protein
MLIFIHRFSAPDLMMRYHWGLGVGHYHAHQPTMTSEPITNKPGDNELEGTYSNAVALGEDDLEYISEDPDLGLDDSHLSDEGWQDTTDGTSDGGGHSGYDSEDIEEEEEEEDFTGW